VQAIRVCREFKKIIKPTTSQSAFYYPCPCVTIPTNVSDKVPLPEKIFVGLSSKQLLLFLLSFNNMYVSFKLACFYYSSFIHTFYMEVNLNSQLYSHSPIYMDLPCKFVSNERITVWNHSGLLPVPRPMVLHTPVCKQNIHSKQQQHRKKPKVNI
jgi:hypothetical protein